jgi:hypothetical protein
LSEWKRSSLVICYWLIVKMIERRENDDRVKLRHAACGSDERWVASWLFGYPLSVNG